ncbi:hypothetical protein JCM19239_6720 [Vibrio variabilis]|nr:hypothetical protein JCM19239_6720 [Vibrio variabilis]
MRFWFSVSTFVSSLAFMVYGLMTLDLYDINDRPGPGYFPLIIGLGLVVTTALNVYKDFQQLRLNKDSTLTQEGSEAHYKQDTIAVTGCITLLIFSLSALGAVVSMMLFCLAFLAYFNRGKWVQNVVYSIAFPMAVFVLFEVWLQAGLPDGILSVLY